MESSKYQSISMLKIIGCLIFDFALVLLFFNIFGLFFIISPVKSILMLFVLLIGLVVVDVAFILPQMIFNNIGIPYSVSIVVLSILYAVLANILSIALISGRIIGYISWELIIFSVFIIIISIIASFLKGEVKEMSKVKKEQDDKNLITYKLMKIEEIFNGKDDQQNILPIISLFNDLKERIFASTPFGRINGNVAVLDIENRINNNLAEVLEKIQENINENDLSELESLIKNTRMLVVNREKLNIK